VGYVYGDSTCGQRALYEVGITGIPVYNVNNNCSTGSTALYTAKQFVEGGVADCVLALGFEKMERGSLSVKYTDRANPIDKHMAVMGECRGITNSPFAPQMFGNAGIEHMEKYGTKPEHFAQIAYKNHKHSVNNPYSQFRDEYSMEDIMKSRKVFGPLTMLQCCPTSDGAAAAVVCSEEIVRKYNLYHQAVEILASAMTTDFPSTFEDKSCIKIVGCDMTKNAAAKVFQQTGLSPEDVQLIELHDCFSCNELITYEGLGLAPEGQAGKLVEAGDNTYGGKWVVNPSGGLISKGHPLGATGLAQCAELCWQLRGMCGKRQVPNAKVALQHNLGLGGAAVVTLYRLGFREAFRPYPADRFNPAIDSRTDIVPDQVSQTTAPAPASAGISVEAVFDQIAKQLEADPSLVQKVNAVYQFVVTSGSNKKTWTVDLKTGPKGKVVSGAASGADCTLTLAEKDFVDLVQGKLDAQSAFMKGLLKLSGNVAQAMKLSHLFSAHKKAAL